MPPKCDQCDSAYINGVYCHETGCPNQKKTWVEDEGWVRFYECRECGDMFREDEECDCQDETSAMWRWKGIK